MFRSSHRQVSPAANRLMFTKVNVGHPHIVACSVSQAQELLSCADVSLAVNLQLREEVLLEKCMGEQIKDDVYFDEQSNVALLWWLPHSVCRSDDRFVFSMALDQRTHPGCVGLGLPQVDSFTSRRPAFSRKSMSCSTRVEVLIRGRWFPIYLFL